MLGGTHQAREGYAHFCCLRPIGSVDLYRARLSEMDHTNSRGDALGPAAAVVPQDRSNYHGGRHRDAEGSSDRTWGKQSKRARLEELLRAPGAIPADAEEADRRRWPLVEVVIWADRAE